MPSVEEAANTFANDMAAQNIAGLMMAFTPDGMMKAMVIQGQMQARTAEAMAAGKAPPPVTGHKVQVREPEGEKQVVTITLENADGTADILTRWRQIEGVWKVNDFSLAEVRDAEGKPVDLSALAGQPPTPPAATSS